MSCGHAGGIREHLPDAIFHKFRCHVNDLAKDIIKRRQLAADAGAPGAGDHLRRKTDKTGKRLGYMLPGVRYVNEIGWGNMLD